MTNKVKEMTLIPIFPALMAVTAGLAIPMVGGLPKITLQTMFVFIAGLLLHPKLSGYSMVIYVLLGAVGLPIFSGYVGGFSVFATASGGFLIGFIIVAIYVGFAKHVKIVNKEFLNLLIILASANVLLYTIGTIYIMVLVNGSFWPIMASMSIYFIGDVLKILAAIYVYLRIRTFVTYE